MSPQRLDPIATSQSIEESYRGYLRSVFQPRRPDLARDFEAQLRGENSGVQLVSGPYLQATPPYEPGRPLRRFVEDGVLHPGVLRLGIPEDRPLYDHQDRAITKAAGGRNLVVATGTGSGKTEGFLLPILDGLLREREAGTLAKPGVRALLLYPMNALVNDQLKRLRQLLVDTPDSVESALLKKR